VTPEWAPEWAKDAIAARPPAPGTNPLSGIIAETWELYRRHAGRLLPVSAVCCLAIYLSSGIVAVASHRLGGWAPLALGAVAAVLLTWLVSFFVKALTADVMQQARARDAGETAWPRLRTCLGEVTAAWLLVSLAELAGFVLGVIPCVYLMTMWAVVVPVIVIEGAGPRAALRRGSQLTRGNRWHVFGTLAVIYLYQIVMAIIARIVFAWLPSVWENAVAGMAVSTLIIPATAVAATLMYYRLAAIQAPADPS
jgi:Membrane domain of glycerophosphoryl diester phosphodiesterase